MQKIKRDSSGAVTITIPLNITLSLGSGNPSGGLIASQSRDMDAREGQEAATDYSRFSVSSLSVSGFDWQAALSCALASKLAYGDRSTVEAMRDAWNLESLPFMEAIDTQCFVAVGSDVVLVSFRGTESVADWLADFNALRTNRPYGDIHRGFYHAFNDIRNRLEQALSSAGARRLVLTGHSLGGALATVAAAEWFHSRAFTPSAVFTYGQPRVGKPNFREFLTARIGSGFFRFVNDDDIVTRVPPGYQHVGRLFHFDGAGDLQESTTVTSLSQGELPALSDEEFDRLRSDLLRQRRQGDLTGVSESTTAIDPELEGFFPSVRDHAIDNYIHWIAQQTL